MFAYPLRAGRWPLALSLGVLAACSDDRSLATAPLAQPKPSFAIGEVITVTNNKGTTEAGSLRWALSKVTGGEIIRFDARLAGSTILLDSTAVIPNYVTVEGPAEKGITISGGGKGRVFDIAASISPQPATTFRNVTITGGKAPNEGGAGIRAPGALVVENSTLYGNEAGGSPAILAYNYGRIQLTNSTVTGNTGTVYGYPAVYANQELVLENSTVAYNSQGGIAVGEYGTLSLRSSILAYNGTANCSFIDYVQYSGRSISDDWTCGDDSTVVLIADPKLGALHDNGGPTMTHALGSESPAINAAQYCSVRMDQRYEARDDKCDIGAFESKDLTTVSLSIDRIVYASAGGYAAVNGSMKCSRAGDQLAVLVQVQQKRSDNALVLAQGSAIVNVTCGTAPQLWTAKVFPSAGTFTGGGGTATAATYQTPSWVTPETATKSVKLVPVA